jgi:hypothetical protein
MSGHTPGEWRAVVGPKDEQPQILYWGLVAILERSPEEYVSVVTDGNHVVEPEDYVPNARLIAASPDLAQLARDVALFFEGTDAPLGERARSLIARLEGREP